MSVQHPRFTVDSLFALKHWRCELKTLSTQAHAHNGLRILGYSLAWAAEGLFCGFVSVLALLSVQGISRALTL